MQAFDEDLRCLVLLFQGADDSESSRAEETGSQRRKAAFSTQEKHWQQMAYDYELRFCGHCNTTTDIKEANFFGRSCLLFEINYLMEVHMHEMESSFMWVNKFSHLAFKCREFMLLM